VIGFVLRYGQVAFALEGRMIAGRAPECDLYLDAVSVSRKHAAFTVGDQTVTVEDLGSKNGVYVNGTRLVEAVQLRIGDRVVIGSAVMVLGLGERRASSAERRMVTTVPTHRSDEAFPIFLDACARAIAAGKIVEASAGLVHLWTVLMEACAEPEDDPIDPQVVGATSAFLLDLAERTAEGVWIDRMFDLRRAAGQPVDPVTLRRAIQVLGKVEGEVGEGIRRYMAWMQSRPLSVADRIVLRRLGQAMA
jgi:pSer/pThr/pTyr-binding forkhead associated (FHA) protein